MRTSPFLLAGFFIFCILISLSVFEPLINNYILQGHKSTDLAVYARFLPISLEHLLGTDWFGRDIFALLLTGLKNALVVGVLAGCTSTIIAVVVATMAGYSGGKVDAILNSITNAVLVTPSLPILVAISLYVHLDLLTEAFILAIFSWPWAARDIRSQILSFRSRAYVELAQITSTNKFKIMFTEILPNLFPTIGIGLSGAIVGSILAETGLRILGLGPAGIITLGLLLKDGLDTGILSGLPQLTYAPTLMLILIFVSLNFMIIGAETIFNPRLKKITGL